MNLRGVDLNLLVVLDALLDEAHVSRAAARLNLSQPAASNALERLRHLFGDPLLERAGSGMRLTPKAQVLQAPVKNLLADAQAVLSPPTIALADLSQTVRIVMADYPALVVLRMLLQRLARSAPGIDLVLQPWHGADAALEQLARGQSDLAVSVFPAVDGAFRRVHLFDETYGVAMRKDHPAAARFTLERWLSHPHVLVSGRGEMTGALDQALARIGRKRRVAVVVPSFALVPPLLAQSDLIAMLPSSCIPRDRRMFAIRKPPLAVEGFALHLAWHVRREQDPGVRHVGETLRAIFEKGEFTPPG